MRELISTLLVVYSLIQDSSRLQCTHVHPAYGFLSENADFATLLATGPNPITFIGPPPQALRTASDKMLARNLATSLQVRVAPGTHVHSIQDVLAFVQSQASQSRSGSGYPVIIKALDGGGGRGIRIVRQENEVEDSFKRYVRPFGFCA